MPLKVRAAINTSQKGSSAKTISTATVSTKVTGAVLNGTVATIGNAGFESPSLATTAVDYDPANATWAFSGNAGISSNGSALTGGNASAPEGSQVGFVQDLGSFSQAVTLSAGTYTLTFDAAQRANITAGNEKVEVLVDGNVVSVLTPAGSSSTSQTTSAFTVSAGSHTIEFEGLTAPRPLLGDMNGDGTVNAADINPFRAALLDTPTQFAAQFRNAAYLAGDFNGDGTVDAGDINSFRSALLQGATANPQANDDAALIDNVQLASVYIPADNPAATVQGVNYEYYEGTWTDLPNFSTLTPIKGGLTNNFNLSLRNNDLNFGMVFNGYLSVPTSGAYSFYTTSDDGSSLSIDGTPVVDNDGLHGANQVYGTVELAAGLHAFTVEYFQQGGGSELQVGYSGPGVTQATIPDSALFTTPPATVAVDAYGAAGKGSTNDEPAIQAAINAAPDGATLVLDAGATYLLDSGLTIEKPLNIQGNGATLLLDTSSYPQNETIYQQSPLSTADTFTWTQTVAANQTTFAVSIPTNEVEPGDDILLQLGQDPNDPNEPNYAAICQVTANTGSAVTVDTPVPFAITQGNFPNEIQRITDLVQNDSISGLNLNFVAGTTPDTNIWLNITRNMSISNITGSFTIAANIADSENVNISNITGTLDQLDSSGGRAVTAYQSSGLNISNVTVTTDNDSPAVFLESWERNTTISNITVNWEYTGTPSSSVFFFTGNSYNTNVESATINNAGYGEIDLVGSGVQAASYTFGTIDVTGAIKYAPLTTISILDNAGQIYNAADAVTTSTNVITIPKSASGYTVQLPNVNGVIRSISVKISTLTGVQSVTLYAGTATGIYSSDASVITSSLVAGTTVVLPQSFGTDYPLNDPANPLKFVQFYTTRSVPTGATLSVTVTYYPPQAT